MTPTEIETIVDTASGPVHDYVSGREPKPPTDDEIKREVLDALPTDIGVSVQNRWVVLDGTVEWQWQKFEAARMADNLHGVKGITNLIAVKTELTPEQIRQFIEDSLFRNLEATAARITVQVVGGQVILRGKVHSWPERDEAGRIAAFAPGVTAVDNRVTVTFDLPEGGEIEARKQR
jgi:osmotically-inducible protein OsmY